MEKWPEQIINYRRTNRVGAIKHTRLAAMYKCVCLSPAYLVLLGAQLRGSYFNYQMVLWYTGSSRIHLQDNMIWCSLPLQGGFAEEYHMPDGKLKALNAHYLPPMHSAGLTPTIACVTCHLPLWERGPRMATLLSVKLELPHFVDTKSASCPLLDALV